MACIALLCSLCGQVLLNTPAAGFDRVCIHHLVLQIPWNISGLPSACMSCCRGLVNICSIANIQQTHSNQVACSVVSQPLDVAAWCSAQQPLELQYVDLFEVHGGIALKAQLPPYSEAFRGYGLNKQQHAWHAAALGFRFKVSSCFGCEEGQGTGLCVGIAHHTVVLV